MLGSYEALRILHIVGGGLGLVSMFIPQQKTVPVTESAHVD